MNGRTKTLMVSVALFAAWCLAGQERLAEDPPVVPAAKSGSVTGTLQPAGAVRSVCAVHRATGKRFEADRYDAQTGRFTIPDVPGGADYDLVVATTDGRTVEGIDLSFVDADLLWLARLRRKQMGLPAPEHVPFKPRDAETILTFVREYEDFMDTRRVLYLRGWGNRATALVELLRLRPFHQSGPAGRNEIVWRIELWYFRKAGGGWEKLPHVERVLRRFRGLPEELAERDVSYYPELSVRVDRHGGSRPISFKISETADPTRGRPKGAELKLPSRPHLLGLAE